MSRSTSFIMATCSTMLVLGVLLKLVFFLLGLLFSVEFSVLGWVLLVGIIAFLAPLSLLMMSKTLALHQVNGTLILEPQTPEERWLFDTVAELSEKAMMKAPKIATYEAPELNAFIVGPNAEETVLIVSTGLLMAPDHEEFDAVLAHELMHAKNGDMITMILLQGVVSLFTVYIPRFLTGNFSFDSADDKPTSPLFNALSHWMYLLFAFFANRIACNFSKEREFRADGSSVELIGKDKVIIALERLKSSPESQLNDAVATFSILGKIYDSESRMTHPSLPERINTLRHS